MSQGLTWISNLEFYLWEMVEIRMFKDGRKELYVEIVEFQDISRGTVKGPRSFVILVDKMGT